MQVESSLDREDYLIMKNVMDLFQDIRDDRDCEKTIFIDAKNRSSETGRVIGMTAVHLKS